MTATLATVLGAIQTKETPRLRLPAAMGSPASLIYSRAEEPWNRTHPTIGDRAPPHGVGFPEPRRSQIQ